MSRFTYWMSGALFTAFYVLILNSLLLTASLRQWVHPSTYAIGASSDELYYAALVKDVARGNFHLGSVSLFEHRFEIGTTSIASFIQGAVMHLTNLSIGSVMAFGDILFPAVLIIIILAGLRSLFPSIVVSLGIAGLMLTPYLMGLLRPVNPQISLPLFVAYFFLILQPSPHHRLFLVLRGFLLLLLFHVHIILAEYFVLYELCSFVVEWIANRRLPPLRDRVFFLAIPLLLAVGIKAALTVHATDTLSVADNYRRLGVIPSFLPTAPLLQLKVISTLFMTIFVAHLCGSVSCRHTRILVCLLLACLLALNQSLFLGKDVIFGLYFDRPFQLIMIFVWCSSLFSLVSLLWRKILGLIAIVFSLSLLIFQVSASYDISYANDARTFDPNVMAAIAWLNRQPPSLVVAAPIEVANLIPVFTQDYVLFGSYARYQLGTDEELASRYLLYDALFDTPTFRRDHTYGFLLGLYAGNVAARARTMCKIHALISHAGDTCAIAIRKHIFHQDVLALLDSHVADIPKLMHRFSVDIIVSREPLPFALATRCVTTARIAEYLVYDCRSLSRK